MDELWRALRLGDRVRMVHMPNDFSVKTGGYLLHPETEEFYRHLIDESAVLTISKIDAWGVPWIDYTWVRIDGTEELHSLALNHDGLERVS
ncbi:MAG: hypothetical protein U0795_17675 [Pirellulales bacterium]